MKKQLVYLAVAALALGLFAACSSPGGAPPVSPAPPPEPASLDSPSGPASGDSAQVVNPLTEYASVEEAQAALGFPVQTPAWVPDGYTQSLVQTIGGIILEVRYSNGAGEQIVYRTAQGTEDISGDYNSYPYQKEVAAGSLEGILYGDAEGSYRLAKFYGPEGTSYSLGFDVPVDEPTVLNMVDGLGA